MTNSQPTKKFLQQIIAFSFVAQAAFIAVRGNLDVLSGKSPLDVIPSMLAQSIELNSQSPVCGKKSQGK
jgi:hypothetical protein